MSIQEKCKTLGFDIKRSQSWYCVYDKDGNFLKNCNGYKTFYNFVYHQYRVKFE